MGIKTAHGAQICHFTIYIQSKYSSEFEAMEAMYRAETGAYECHEVVQRSIKLPTLVGPILYPIWHLQNAPYKVAACLHLLR